MSKKIRLSIVGMTCVNCSNAIEKVTKKIEGVESSNVSFASSSGEFIVKNDEILEKVIKKIKKLGYDIATDYEELEAKKQRNLNSMLYRLILAAILSVSVMYIEMSEFFSFFAKAVICFILSAAVLFYCGRNFFTHALGALSNKNFDMNVLVSLGSGTAFIYSVGVVVFPNLIPKGFTNLYFSSACMIVTFILFGKYLEERSKLKANDYIKSLIDMSAKTALLIDENGQSKEVLANELKIGDTILVKSGYKIACDGEIIEGGAEIDTSLITGESLPIYKEKGDFVNAGCINTNGILRVKVTKSQHETLLAEILNLLSEAGSKKMPISRFADKIANIFVPSVICIAIATFIIWSILGNAYYGIMCAISVLIISCPCALGLATPIAIVCAISNSAKKGVLVKNPEVLEILKDVKTVVFDKTGTLTKGKISVFDTNLNDADLVKIASVEALSEHLIAKAICDYALKKQSRLPEFDGKFENIVGKGVKAVDESGNILIGNMEFLRENGINFTPENVVKDYLSNGFGVIYIAMNNNYKGFIALSDSIRDGAKDCIAKLCKMGIKTVMLTGDNAKTANFIAHDLKIDTVYAEVLPDEKYEIVNSLKTKGKVLFVGDGINDAPSLKSADAGIAMSGGSDIAKGAGDIVLIRDEISNIIYTINLSLKTMNTVKQNLFWAFFYNLVCIPVAAGVLYPATGLILKPMYGAIAMCFSSVTVVLNSIRLKFSKI